MKNFIKMSAVLIVVSFTQLAVADSGLSQIVPITVTVTTDVQDQINKLTPQDKNRVEESIKVGAAFMQQYLDGLVCDTQNQDWDQEVGRLVVKDAYEWGEKFCSQDTAYFNQKDQRQACSQSSLIALKLENGDVNLKYQLIHLGAISFYLGNPNEFKSHGFGDTETLIVAINAGNRVYDITPQGWPAEIAYSRFIYEAKSFLKFPSGRIGDTQATLKAQGVRYKKLIKQIELQAAQVCK